MLVKALSPNWLTLVLFLLILYLIYRHLTRHHNYWELKGVPYEKPIFLAGNLWEVFSGKRQIGKHLGYLYGKYDTPYFGIYIMGQPYLVIRDPNIIKNLTVRDFNNFEDRTFACDKKADAMSGNSLFVLRNPRWRNIRNKLTPIFTSGKIKMMFPLMNKSAKAMTKYLEKRHGNILDLKDISGNFMTDLVATCFFGFEANSFGDQEECIFRAKSKKMMDLDIFRAFSLFSYFFVPMFVSWFNLKLLDTTFLKEVFLNTLTKREETKVRRNDFVDLLLSLRDSLQEKNAEMVFDTDCMVSQAITFFIAGFETTSNAISFALYELSLRQDCQNILRQEIQDRLVTENDITFENIQQLEYLNMVLAETLRRYPFGPFLNRRCKEDYVIKETGLQIEKGTPILIPIDGLHNDPKYYPEPEKFDPERFREGVKQGYNACTYLPFGMGPRNCIGDRFGLICAKVGLVHFLKNYKIERCHETPVPLELNPKSPFITPIKGLPVTVKTVNFNEVPT